MNPIRRVALPVLALLCFFPFVSSEAALLLGIGVALLLGNPYLANTRSLTPALLQMSVVGLGAGMNLRIVGQVGLQGVGYTVAGIFLTFAVGILLGRLMKAEEDTALLITTGTAICGGSAIVAVAPVIRAKPHEVSVSLGVVFVLNAIALLVFPSFGHWLGLSERQFGLWSALAIHDTSSVVGASLRYGTDAVRIATTVKLARALWIVPVTLAIGAVRSRAGEPAIGDARPRGKKPWFILGFIAASALVTWVPALAPIGAIVNAIAKRALIVTLFLIGTSLNHEALRSVGAKPLVLGVLLWVIISCGTLGAILYGWIH